MAQAVHVLESDERQDCRSEEGKTVGAIDGIIAFTWLLAERDLSGKNVQHALADLFESPEFAILQAARKPLD